MSWSNVRAMSASGSGSRSPNARALKRRQSGSANDGELPRFPPDDRPPIDTEMGAELPLR